MNHTLPKSTAPVDHSAFGQTLTGFEHTLYTNFHHLQYLPLLLFFVACALLLAALVAKRNTAPARVAFYLVAVLLVVAGVYIL